MHHTTIFFWSPPRRFVVGTAAVLANMVWTHGFAAILRHLGPDDAPLAAVPLTVAAILAASVGAAFLPRLRAEAAAAAVASLAALAIELRFPGAGAAALALLPSSVIVTRGARWLGERLPGSVDSLPRFRPGLTVAWVILALVAIVQIGRLTSTMTDHEKGFFLTTDNSFWYKHECIGAYLYGAELTQRGEHNIYHSSHYLGLDPNAAPDSSLEGISIEDPYQYPPQFLLLPRIALWLTDDAATIRVVWFALQTTLFAGIATMLALWVGGPAGRAALWLLPLVMISFPALHNFQFGQFHLAAIAFSVAAMLLFERRHPASGGALLAVAILAKIFPLVLLPVMLVRRQFKALAWTAVWGITITAVSLAILGPAPFTAFFEYHLPRMGDGSAFAFDQAWPEMAGLVLADNQGVFGLGRKLGLDTKTAAGVARVFGLVVLAFAAFITLRRPAAPRISRAITWLALLGLASLTSPGAWGDYVPVTAVWLLSLLVVPMVHSRVAAIALGVAWILQFFVLGTMPLGDWAPLHLMVPLSAVGALVMMALFFGAMMSSGDATARERKHQPEVIGGEGRAEDLRPAA